MRSEVYKVATDVLLTPCSTVYMHYSLAMLTHFTTNTSLKTSCISNCSRITLMKANNPFLSFTCRLQWWPDYSVSSATLHCGSLVDGLPVLGFYVASCKEILLLSHVCFGGASWPKSCRKLSRTWFNVFPVSGHSSVQTLTSIRCSTV